MPAQTMRTPGTDVIVKSLKKRGVVTGVIRPGVYRVQVGALSVTAREDELEIPTPSKKKKGAAPVVDALAGTGEGAFDGTRALASVDLHGLTVDDARNRVAGHISRAILAGLDRVEIIHGIGTGKVKAAVTRDLKAIGAVRAVKPHPTNPGVTVVYL
jgi:DNA mismatch repair protein MutS2